jgi:3',5'-cyclic AMP phosphodiesterase CpdA
MAREFVQRLPSPRLIIPGNHDLPVFHLWEALTDPLRRFREYVTADEPFFHVPGLAVIGIDSTLRLLSSGYLRPAHLRQLAVRLQELPVDTCRVVVVHHPLVPPPRPFKWRRLAGLFSDLVIGTRRALDVFEDCGVELVLSGHLHHAFIGNSLDFRSRGAARSWCRPVRPRRNAGGGRST